MAVSEEIMLKVENVSKIYKLGEIGGTTLRDELQRLGAKIRHKPDPTKKVGAKDYNKGEKFKALDNVSFEVKKGERIGIIGHNGAGKSTLLKLISRVTGPTSGNIYMNGRVASMLEVGTGFHPELTGRENVYMNGAILGMTKKEIDAKMEDIIEFSEVRQFIDTPVKRYSSGMYVKLAFSVAAHLDSEIMIMDEVLAVGDVAFQNKCLNKMKEVSEQEERTILYVSHNMKTITELCDKVLVLSCGRIVYYGDVDTGISFYLNINGNGSQNLFALKDVKRPDHFKQVFLTEKFDVLNSSDGRYKRYEPIKFRLSWSVLEAVKNSRIRIVIKTFDGILVGTSISEQLIDCSKTGNYIRDFELNISPLAPGKYVLSLIFFEFDNLKQSNTLDHLENIYYFYVEDSIENLDYIANWNKKYWGNIHLPNIILK